MRRFRAALAPAMLAISTIVSTGGCARATSEPAPSPIGVSYVSAGWVLADANAAAVLDSADANARRAELSRVGLRVERSFVVPAATFEWLFKQAARSRRDAVAPKEE
jgi:hypothetical protein